MRINVKVKANAKQELVEQVSQKEFNLRVKAPAYEGKANSAVIELLSDYFDIPKSRIGIISGRKNKNKIIEIIDGPVHKCKGPVIANKLYSL